MEKKNNWAEVFKDEWPYIQRLGKAFSDPEEKKSFWETVKAKKRDDPSYSIYSDFPRGDSMQICKDILKALALVNAKSVEMGKAWTPKRSAQMEMLGRLYGELILQGFHDPKKEESA